MGAAFVDVGLILISVAKSDKPGADAGTAGVVNLP